MQVISATRERMSQIVAGLDVIDTHDHLRFVGDLGLPMTVTALFRNTYVARCLRVADGSANGIGTRSEWVLGDDLETALEVARKVRLTSYFRWLMRGLAELYDLPGPTFDAAAYERLSVGLTQNYQDASWIPSVLDRARIQAVIWDPFWKPGTWDGPDPRLIPSFRITSSVAAFHPDASDYEGCNLIRDWADALQISVNGLGDLESLIERVLGLNLDAGARSIKSAVAYERPLRVGPPRRQQAAALFGKSPQRITEDERLVFGDYVIHVFMDLARQHNLVVQVHTGLARLADSNPMEMLPLIEAYPEVTFDLFHGGYPWIHEVGAIAQNYPNVRLNLAWLPQLSTEAAVVALKEWLQVTPQQNRISWGADCWTVEEMYGAQLAARYVVGRALAELLDEGYLDPEGAVIAAKSVLSGAGGAIYGVGTGLGAG